MRLLAFLLMLVAGGGVADRSNAATINYTADPTPVINPERGLYAWGPLAAGTDFNQLRADGNSVCFAPIELDPFTTTSISQTRLNQISNAFGRLRAAKLKALVRIRYNEDAGGTDASLAQMEVHLQQLQPILAANEDVIACFQAGMIGAWGEWHTSSNGLDNAAGRQAVWNLLVQYLPQHSFIQIRTPGYINELESIDSNPLNDATAFQNTARSRIAFHNDCWISSDTDYGTYPAPGPAQVAIKNEMGNHTRYTPFFAEICDDNPLYANCTNLLADGALLHLTYIDVIYNASAIANLTSAGCWDTLKQKIGYCFQLTSSTLPNAIAEGQSFSVQINLKNNGWAPVYLPRPVYLCLIANGTVIQSYALNADPRFWRPEAGLISLTATFTAPANISASSVDLALWMPDPSASLQAVPEYSIRTVNIGTWNAVRGDNVLGSGIPVQQSAQIDIDGNMSDWGAITPILSDPSGDQNGAEADYTTLYVAEDAQYIYLRIKTANSVDLFATGLNNLFFDMDQNGATGFQAVGASIGSEWLLQAGSGYDERNGTFNAGSISGLNLLHAPTGATTDVELRLARTATYPNAAPVFSGSGFRILLESENSSFVTRETMPNTGLGQYPYGLNFVPVELSTFFVE
jgi:hypothetical protein